MFLSWWYRSAPSDKIDRDRQSSPTSSSSSSSAQTEAFTEISTTGLREAAAELSINPPPGIAQADIPSSMLIMQFLAPGMYSSEQAPMWEAKFILRTSSIHGLMESGFSIRENIVMHDEGYFLTDWEVPRLATNHRKDWRYMRRFALEHTSTAPRWAADVLLFSREMPVMANFEVTRLSRPHITDAWAWNEHGLRVYNYSASDPLQNLNTILGHRPLTGWWPWPRNDGPQHA